MNRKTSSFIVFGSAIVLLLAGIAVLYSGIRIKGMSTVQSLDKGGTVLMVSILFFILMLIFAGFSYYVLRRTYRKGFVVTYAVMLFVSLLLFGGIAISSQIAKGKVNEEFAIQCGQLLVQSDLQKVDALYATANGILCNTCFCRADPALWGVTPDQNLVENISIGSLLLDPSQETVHVKMNPHGDPKIYKSNIQECPGIKGLLTAEEKIFSGNLTQAMQVLGGIEKDFQCAGMCQLSTYYTFSNVGMGRPKVRCADAVPKQVSEKVNYLSIWFWIFTVLTLISFIYVTMLASRKHSDLEDPLLGLRVE